MITETEAMMKRAGDAGVARMLCNATREEDWQAVIDLATNRAEVTPFLGIHPWFAESAGPGWEERLLRLLEQIPAGIGESGLDKSCRADFADQQQVFLAQLRMASALKRPLVLHCVKAWGRLLEILEECADALPPTMIHSFAGSRETLERLIRLGCFISFSGRLATDRKLQSCLTATPLGRLLLETDAPGHTTPKKMFCAEPAAITGLYRLAAEMRGMDLNEFRQEIWSNGKIFTDTIVPR